MRDVQELLPDSVRDVENCCANDVFTLWVRRVDFAPKRGYVIGGIGRDRERYCLIEMSFISAGRTVWHTWPPSALMLSASLLTWSAPRATNAT